MAWADGVLTESERAELRGVAQLLAIPADRLAAALQGHRQNEFADTVQRATGSFHLIPADRIVLTGTTSKPRAEWHAELEALGFIPTNNVSRKVKLVVAADPDSMSGKARKARELGIPVVDEAGLISLLEKVGRGPG